MGEEVEKPVKEKEMEEKKPDEAEEDVKKPEEKKPEPPPEKQVDSPAPVLEKDAKEEEKKPREIVLKLHMHCEGCAKKVRRCLKGFEGVENVMTDCKSSKVVVEGDKADPLKVLARLQRKSNRQVELLSPIPDPKPVEERENKPSEDDKPKTEEKEEVVTVVLRVYMHCEACAMEIQKRILRMKGVESVEPDYQASLVSVRGVFSPPKLVEYIYKRTGKHTAVIKQDPPAPAPENDKESEATPKEDKKNKKKNKKTEEKPKEETGNEVTKETKDPGAGKANPADDGGGAAAEGTVEKVEVKRNEYYYYQPTRYPPATYAYPPQLFSDENPNACTVM